MSPRRESLIRMGIALVAGTLVMIGALAQNAHGQEAPNIPRVIGRRPAGCPHAWCGCGLAHFLGLDDKRLNLAWNWARLFPHVSARAGAAAVRHHHVMLLVRHIKGTRWLVRSYNDYRHKAWLIERDVRGYVFVDPSNKVALQ